MITLPWQIVAAAIASFTLVTIVMAYTIRDKAEREHQRREQNDRLTQKAIYEGLKHGFDTAQEFHQQAHEDSICHYRKHAAPASHKQPSDGPSA